MVPADWREVLIRELSGKLRHEPDWSRPSRRIIAISANIARRRGRSVVAPVYHPSRYKQVYERPRIAIIFDVSGAISIDFYGSCVISLNECIKHISPEELRTLYCDHEVRREEYYGPSDTKTIKPPEDIPPSKGPSAYTPAFRHMEERGIRVGNAVYLTDLCPTEPLDIINRELPTLLRLVGIEKLLWLTPSEIREKGDFWKPIVGKIVWI